MLLIQFLIVGFALFAISKTLAGFKKGRISAVALIIWLTLWTAAALATLLPKSTVFFAKILGVSRGTDVVVYLSIVVLFYIAFKIYTRLERIESDISAIIKEIALRAGDKKEE